MFFRIGNISQVEIIVCVLLFIFLFILCKAELVGLGRCNAEGLSGRTYLLPTIFGIKTALVSVLSLLNQLIWHSCIK